MWTPPLGCTRRRRPTLRPAPSPTPSARPTPLPTASGSPSTAGASHGSRPEDGIDPINVLAHIVIALQAINSRERNQKEPLILTCGQISAGTAENIIPESGFITGTIRAFNQEVREQAKRRLVEISDLTARTFGASAEVEWYTEFAPDHQRHPPHRGAGTATPGAARGGSGQDPSRRRWAPRTSPR